MPLELLPQPRFQAFNLGVAAPGALAYFYAAGTTTPLNTYSSADGDISHLNANPVIADSGGLFGAIYLLPESYKMVLKTSAGATIFTQDNITGPTVSGFINVLQFGAKGDDSTDDTAAIQAGIDYCIETQQSLYFPALIYKITAPLHIWSWDGAQFSQVSCRLIGAKPAFYFNQGSIVKSATLHCTHKATAAIFIQEGRAVTIENIYAVGQNVVDVGAFPDYPDMLTNASYVQNGCRDSRYSPYSGVCIDPFGTAVPADGGYPGFSIYYVATNAGSSKTTISGCAFQNFIVGLMGTPNANTQNNEDVTVSNTAFWGNKVSVAMTQVNQRNWNLFSCTSQFALFGFDGASYGAQQGYAPNIFGLNASGKYLFNTNLSFTSTSIASAIYAENLGSLGWLGAVAANQACGVDFVGGAIQFNEFSNVAADHHLVCNGPIKFSGTTFTRSTQNFPLRFYHGVPQGPIVFEACQFVEFGSEFTLALSGSGVQGQAFDDILFINAHLDFPSTGRQNFSHFLQRNAASVMDKKFIPLGAQLRTAFLATGTFQSVDVEEKAVSLGSHAMTIAAGVGSLNPSDASIVRVGEMIVCSTSVNYENYDLTQSFASSWEAIGIVLSNDGTTITIGGLPQSFIAGTYAFYKQWIPRYHSATVGDTHTNTTVDNVSDATAWEIGDPISGAGIVAGTYIANISGTTFTLSKAATASATVRLYDADVYVYTGAAL